MEFTGLIQFKGRWLRLHQPTRIITAVSPSDLIPKLEEVETAVEQEDFIAVGYLTYEASSAFGFKTHAKEKLPLLWFALFEPAHIEDLGQEFPLQRIKTVSEQESWQPNLSASQYQSAINTIKENIAQGNTYQVNYTFHLRRQFAEDPLAYFQRLAQAQQAEYMAYLDTGDYVICSASPELFFTLDGDHITSKPMKGTAVRGRTYEEDQANIAWLAQSEKNRAENVMIVDMIRNDMGQIAEVGSVQVPKLFDVEPYPTLLQMTSTVTAKTKRPLAEIISAMFPCASITGAPKKRTMDLIHNLEKEPRGLYTGSIGIIAPNRQVQFNVAIRTVVIDKKQQEADFGVGSGIVWDSETEDEFNECQVKASVLTTERPTFDLLESLLWEPETGYFLLEEHLNRLQRSAHYFGIEVNETAVLNHLYIFADTLKEACKIRLLLSKTGKIVVQSQSLAAGALPEPVRIGIAREAISSNTVWLYHKTTLRKIYNEARASRPDCDDVILWNERQEITEASSSNIVLSLDGRLVTPPIASGLLAGTFRESLLQNGRIQEQVLTLNDLHCADDIFLLNSVRRWRQAIFVDSLPS